MKIKELINFKMYIQMEMILNNNLLTRINLNLRRKPRFNSKHMKIL